MTETVDLFYRERGTGHPVLMLHGLFGSMENLGGLSRQLEQTYRVIGIDLRNHGRSPHTDTMNYSGMAADVLRLMDHLGLEQAHVFGHSMGGKTAMQLALTVPYRVSKLLVGDIAPVAYGNNHGDILTGMQKVATAAPDSRKGAQDILSAYVDEPAVLGFLLTNWRRLDTGVFGWRLNLDTIVRDYASIMTGNDGTPYEGPALFLRGGMSDYVMAGHRARILELFPKATSRTVEGTGHWLHAEKPDLVGRIIERFFGE